jgi:molybdopterin-guanine dinucleotide biosynthesis protein MobB
MKVFGFAGYSGSGKTTLIEQLIPLFTARGLRVSLIKQTHHDVDLDQPGKDSWRHRQAGCGEVMLASSRRWALMHELRDEPEPGLDALVGRLSPCDLVLVEGFKSDPIPKLEIHRQASGKPLLFPGDPHIVAVATDEPLATDLPQFDLNQAEDIAAFILQTLNKD